MLSLRSIICYFSLANCASNDNAAHDHADTGNAAARAIRRADPYLTEAAETKRLIGGARLISSVDGNPAAVLNLMATRSPRGRRAA